MSPFQLICNFFVRFSITNELHVCDFDNNKDWFKNKIIGNINSPQKLIYIKNEMNLDFYTKKLTYISESLQLVVPGIKELGRKVASAIMEILQMLLEYINILGI